MTDGTALSVPPIHLSLIHSENVFVDHFLQTHHIIKPHIYSSDLSALIPNPTVLAKVERNPFLRAAILSNPSLAEVISYNPVLLDAIVKNPGLLTALISGPGLLSLIYENPFILSEIIKNPNTPVDKILEGLTKKTELKLLANFKSIVSVKNIPHPMAISEIAAHRVPTGRAALRAPSVELLETMKQQASQIIQAKILQKSIMPKILLPVLRVMFYQNARSLVLNPALLALLGGAAFAANRVRIMPASGSLKDIGIELETQSERQLDILQGIGPVHEVEDTAEIHLMRETIA